MNKIFSKISLLIVGSVLALSVAICPLGKVFAQSADSTTPTVPTAPANPKNIATSLSTTISQADGEIDQRTANLNDIITRIGEVQKLSTTNQALLIASVQNEISQLAALRSKIDSETNAAAAKIDYQSITQSYRIYDLIVPQTRIIIATDKVISIVSSMNLVAGKIQSRTSNISGINSITVQQQYSDSIAKITDASVQAMAATSEVIRLFPDQGNTKVLQSNTSALNDARAKLKTATDDLTAARDDFGNIISFLKENADTKPPPVQ